MSTRKPIQIRRIPIISVEKQKQVKILKPAKEVALGTDNLNRQAFLKMTPKAMDSMLTQKKAAKVVETETQKINGEYKEVEAITKFWFEVVEGCDLTKIVDLTPTDQWVLGACMAEIQKGNGDTTANIIYRDCGGSGNPSPQKIEEILQSVDKMIGLKVRIDATDTKNKLKQLSREYSEDFKEIVVGTVLPAYYQYTVMNGVPNTITITFYDISPLFKYALAKGQVTTIPSELLNVPKRKNTPHFQQLKGYINIRIQSIKRTRKHNKQFPAIITMEDMIKNCGFQATLDDKHFRKRLWEDITLYMEFLIDKGTITGFKCLTKDGKEMKKWQDNGKIFFTYPADSIIQIK